MLSAHAVTFTHRKRPNVISRGNVKFDGNFLAEMLDLTKFLGKLCQGGESIQKVGHVSVKTHKI